MLALLMFVAVQAPVPAEPAPLAVEASQAAPTEVAPTAETAPVAPAQPVAPTVAPSPPPAEPESCTLAVLDLDAGEGMSKPRAVALSDIVTGEVGALSGCSVLSRSDVRGVLSFEAEKQLLGCSSDSSCLAELAGALGADLLVTGSVSKIEGSMLVSLRMTDMKKLKVVRRATDSFAGSDDQAIPFVGWIARKLITDDPAKVGVKPVAVARGGDPVATTRGTIWGTLAWTGVILTSVSGVLTAALGGTTLGLSEYTKELKTNGDFVDTNTLDSVRSFGEMSADGTNIGVYATAGLLLITMPLFLLPHQEPIEDAQ